MSSTSSFKTTFNAMSDSQLRQTISQLSTAASRPDHFVAPTPQPAQSRAYLKNLHTWSASVTPPPSAKTPGGTRAGPRTRASKQTPTQPIYTPPAQTYHPPQPAPILPQGAPNPPRPPIPTTPQALHSTYASRLRTGTTLLMQPIINSNTAGSSSLRTATRRGAVINYADPGSGDDMPDAGAIDSDDSDFVASGGTRTAIRTARGRMTAGMSVFHSGTGVTTTPHHPPPPPPPPKVEKAELDQSYLGMVPPAKFIKARPVGPTAHEYPSHDSLEVQAKRRTALVPIRVEFETDTHRIRDCFVWNLHERLLKPETFARIFCVDLDLPIVPWAETVTNQIRAQLEEHEGVASVDLGVDTISDDANADHHQGDEHPECRVILSIDVQIATYHLLDHIEWDLLSPLTPEEFSQKLCTEIGLSGEAIPLIAHAIHEELIKHKKDAIEWGVIGGDRDNVDDHGERPRDKTGLGLMKLKTGLGLGWGRTPKDGRGPKPLRSVWRDWAEAEEFRTRFEVLSAEEVERREIERERASRRLRRETSKFQTTRSRRR